MLYTTDITTPANTAEADAVKTTLKLTHGIVHRVSIGFPDGCAGLAHLQLYRFEHQVWPTNSEADFNWNNVNLEWDDYFELLKGPFTLMAKTWNEDDTYQHIITVRLGIVPPETYWRTGPTQQMEARLKEAFGI